MNLMEEFGIVPWKNMIITYDNDGEIIIAKQRNGPVGTVNVEWQAEFARYTNLPGTRVAMYTEG